MARRDGDITLSVDVEAADVKTATASIIGQLENIFARTKGKTGLSDAFRNAQVSAARLYDEIRKARVELAELELSSTQSELNDPGTTIGAQYLQLIQRLNDLTNRGTLVTDKLTDLANVEVPTSKFAELSEVLKMVAKGAGQAALSITKMVGSALKSKISDLARSMKNLTKNTRGQNNALQMGFKNFIRYGLGVRSIFALINKLRRALYEGIGNLAQYSPDFNAVVSDFISALATLKNAFAAAFSPILSVALPALTALMNALLDAIAVIGSFFSALTGHTTFIKAKRLNKDYAASLSKTGSSAGDAAGGISDANDAAKELKRTIAGFDDVEILQQDKSSGSSGGGGGGGGGGGIGDISPADMFETVDVESPIADFANRLRELIANQDWEGLGQFLGENINSIFEKAKELISWDNLGAKITFIVNAIATTFNSLVDTVDWELIGSTFAEGINTLIKTLDLLIIKIDWKLLGRSIAEGWNGLFKNIHWQEAGQLIANGINAVFDFLYEAITTFDWGSLSVNVATSLNRVFTNVRWQSIGKTFGEGVNAILNSLYEFITTFDWARATSQLMSAINAFIKTVDWARLGAVLGELIKALLQTFKTAIAEFDWRSIGTTIVEFLSGVDWLGLISSLLSTIVQLAIMGFEINFGVGSALIQGIYEILQDGIDAIKDYFATYGGNIVQGLYDGITEALAKVGKWIVDNVFNPFIDAFKDAFGINSPSKVMEEQGGYIIDGLYEGITSKWKTIKEYFNKGVKGLTEIFKAENWKERGSEIVQKVKGGLSGTWSTLSSLVSGKISSVKGQFTKTNWKPGGTSIVSGIKGGIQSLWSSNIVSYFSGRITDIKNQFNKADWSSSGKTVVNKLKSGVQSLWSSNITVYFGERIIAIKKQFTESNWASTGQTVVNKLKSGINSKYSTITTRFGDMVGAIKNKFNNTNWESVGENICRGIRDGVYGGWDWVTSATRSMAQAALDAVENKLKINSPSKVFRDRVGMAIPEGIAAGVEKGNDMALTAVSNLSKSIANQDIPQLQIPSVALGKIIPYEMSKNVDTLNESIKSLVDVLKYNQSNTVTREDITNVLNEVLPTMLQRYVTFYIGDEQIARHANAGNVRLDYRFNPVGK